MPNDPNAAELVAAAASPEARYPLVGSATTVTVKLATIALQTHVISTFTRVWGGADPTDFIHNAGSEQNLFPPQNRSGAVSLQVGTSRLASLIGQVFNRQWNGIGGIGYLPSFPQLDRKNTTWPHAS